MANSGTTTDHPKYNFTVSSSGASSSDREALPIPITPLWNTPKNTKMNSYKKAFILLVTQETSGYREMEAYLKKLNILPSIESKCHYFCISKVLPLLSS